MMSKPNPALSLLIVTVLIVSGCSLAWHKKAWTQKGVAGEWHLQVPSGLVHELDLNRDAILELHSPDADFFLVLRRDSLLKLRKAHSDFVLEDFLDLSIEKLIESVSDPAVPQAAPTYLHERPAHRATITGVYKNDPVRYELAIIKGPVFMYQLLIWIPEAMKDRYQPMIEQVIQSTEVVH